MKLTEVKILDKKEYRARLDEINNLVEKQDYREALNVVETIEWRRVRSARTLCMVSEIYEVNKRYDDSLRLLLLAYQRAPSGKLILYRLVELSVKMTDYESAVKYYNQFMKLSPNDNNRYILKYKIYKGRKNPIEDQIKILEKYKASEYTERWAYELARLYARAGMYDKCIAECDEMVLWFSDGKYVKKALELKMKYTELTDAEKEKYKELYGEPKAVRIARTAASVSAATQAAAKMLNQTAQTMVKPEEAVNSVKAEAFQLPKPEAIKKAESGAGSEAKAEEEVKPELAEQPKIMKMPEFIKTPEVKPDFEPLPEIQMPEEIKKEIGDLDFLTNFLENTKKGYSVHYATAAALMFRYYKIPARYVEGYVITPDDVKSMKAGEPYTVDGTHAHAWVEYYQDGVGWLPFESTPSYLGIMETAEDYQDISGITSGIGADDEQEQQDEQDNLEDEEQPEEEEDEIDWILILEMLLGILIVLITLFLILIIVKIIRERIRCQKIKKLFDSEDYNQAVNALFEYTMNILAVFGLKVRNASLYRYGSQIESLFDEEMKIEYTKVVDIRQEAVYSSHSIAKEQRDFVMEFKNKVWEKVYKEAGWLERFQLKFIYFL